METMIQARKGDSEFMQEYNNARKERNSLFDRVNKNETSSIPNPRDYIEL